MTYIVEDALVVMGPGHAGELDLLKDIREVFRRRGLLELSTQNNQDIINTPVTRGKTRKMRRIRGVSKVNMVLNVHKNHKAY